MKISLYLFLPTDQLVVGACSHSVMLAINDVDYVKFFQAVRSIINPLSRQFSYVYNCRTCYAPIIPGFFDEFQDLFHVFIVHYLFLCVKGEWAA